jgi:hypothetical protein
VDARGEVLNDVELIEQLRTHTEWPVRPVFFRGKGNNERAPHDHRVIRDYGYSRGALVLIACPAIVFIIWRQPHDITPDRPTIDRFQEAL